MKRILLIFLALLITSTAALAQDYFADTVWTRKTDQTLGFYMVKFSKTDTFIVGHGYEKAIFYDALTSNEIMRLPFNAEVHFFDNDNKFIQLAPSRDRLVIFDAKTFMPIDTLEYDDKLIGSITISKDENLLAGIISTGLRIWDLKTGKILQEKEFEEEENLVGIRAMQIVYTNDNNKLIFLIERTYNKNGNTYYTYRVEIWNAMSLIKEDFYRYKFSFRLSNTNKYIAFKTDDKYNGVEIYDFNTKQLLRRLPVNGPSLTGIEFSPDDKYIVTSVGLTHRSLTIWNIEAGNAVYEFNDGGYENIDISHSGQFIISSIGNYLLLYPFKTNTSTQEKEKDIPLLYPNPATGEVIIKIDNHTLQGMGDIKVYDVRGECVLEHPAATRHPSTRGELMRIDVSKLSPGEYFVRVGDRVYKFVKL